MFVFVCLIMIGLCKIWFLSCAEVLAVSDVNQCIVIMYVQRCYSFLLHDLTSIHLRRNFMAGGRSCWLCFLLCLGVCCFFSFSVPSLVLNRCSQITMTGRCRLCIASCCCSWSCCSSCGWAVREIQTRVTYYSQKHCFALRS